MAEEKQTPADKLAIAETALANIEAPKVRFNKAVQALETAGKLSDEDMDYKKMRVDKAKTEALAAESAYHEHVAKWGGESRFHSEIDARAQAVLDARGESHTEENILPTDKA